MYEHPNTDHDNLGTLHFQDGFTPLMVAAQEGHLSIVELLVSEGAQVNSQDNVSNWMYNRVLIVYTVSL